jgi:UDP-N-acetylmuramate dehydrogenase
MTEFSIEQNVLLSQHTTLGVGGMARFWACPSTKEQLLYVINWAREQGVWHWVIGGGSNVVIADRGLSGLVMRWEGSNREIYSDDGQTVEICVEGGHSWDDLVHWTVAQNLSGIECLSGIPGLVGAAPIQNIGAYGQELADSFVEATIIDLYSMEISRWNKQQCQFGYRYSKLKAEAGRRFLVIEIKLRLMRNASPCIRYPELARALSSRTESCDLASVREAILALRRSKSMLLDPQDPCSKSAGSFFTNPILSSKQFTDAAKRLHLQEQDIPHYLVEDGHIKIPAAWLIEHSGLTRGYSWPTVGLSPHHALAIINRSNASASDIAKFACFVRDRVLQFSGIQLQPEPIFLGFEHDLFDMQCRDA